MSTPYKKMRGSCFHVLLHSPSNGEDLVANSDHIALTCDALFEVFTYMCTTSLSDGQLENLLVPLEISFHTEESHWPPRAINLNTPERNAQSRIGLTM